MYDGKSLNKFLRWEVGDAIPNTELSFKQSKAYRHNVITFHLCERKNSAVAVLRRHITIVG